MVNIFIFNSKINF